MINPTDTPPEPCDNCGNGFEPGQRWIYHARLRVYVHETCTVGALVRGEDISTHTVLMGQVPPNTTEEIMTLPITPIGRAAAVIASSRPYGPASQKARVVLAAALDDPDLAPRVSQWRDWCKHSEILNPDQFRDGDTAQYEQACSPCVRDRLRAWLLGES